MDSFLKHFHTRYDGSFPKCPTTLGESSYALLAQVSRTRDLKVTSEKPTIVDLGCGGGVLLHILRDMHGSDARLIGVDLVHEQIERAQSLLADPSIELLCEPAQQLPIKSETVDFLLVHMGLAVMQPLELVLKEIDRVLRPGGLFAVVIERDPETPSIDSQCSSALLKIAKKERPDLIKSAAADSRIFTPEALTQVIASTTKMAPYCEHRPFDLLLNATAEQYIDFARGDYLWPYVSPHGQEELCRQIRGIFSQAGHEGARNVPITMTLLCFQKSTP